MTDHRDDAAALDLAERMIDTARGLDAAAKAGALDEFDFALLQNQLQDFYRDAGRIASRLHAG